ncbi:hypothetical protein [Dactylosporangium sucinum]|uniref:hypothetical protein n=1 Tax=Dactylosporangium sucinum TaxID=1424081 RepID=UPI001E6386F5|nr:hypothetical protein [Dactylosporangium sucinum]
MIHHKLGERGSRRRCRVRLAPESRRGEVTAAFISCVYLGVTAASISVGLRGDALSLYPAVCVVAAGIAAVALPTAVWHGRHRRFSVACRTGED